MAANAIRVKLIRDVEWVADEDRTACKICNVSFGFFTRKHHCRLCGEIVCKDCSPEKVMLKSTKMMVRACNNCYKIAEENYLHLKAVNKTKRKKDAAGSSLSKPSLPSLMRQESRSAVVAQTMLGLAGDEEPETPPVPDAVKTMSIFLPAICACIAAATAYYSGYASSSLAGGFSAWTIVVVTLMHVFLAPKSAAAKDVANETEENTERNRNVSAPTSSAQAASGTGIPVPKEYVAGMASKKKLLLYSEACADSGGVEGWKLFNTKKDIKCWRKKGENGESNWIMGTGVIEAPTRAVLDVLMSNTPKVRKAMDDMFDTGEILAKYDNQNWLDYSLYKAIWPVAARHFTMAVTWEVLSDGATLLLAFSVPEVEATPKNKKAVTGWCSVGGWIIRPMDGGKTKVTYVAQLSLGGSVPTYVMNFIANSQPMQVHTVGQIIKARDLTIYLSGERGPLTNGENSVPSAEFEESISSK